MKVVVEGAIEKIGQDYNYFGEEEIEIEYEAILGGDALKGEKVITIQSTRHSHPKIAIPIDQLQKALRVLED